MKLKFNKEKIFFNVTLIFAVVLILSFTGCKKNSTPSPKDYSASIKDKNWWGVVTYTGETSQYYSVHFNADNTLVWSQLSGDDPGQWTLQGKTLTIHFSGSKEKDKDEIKVDISDDDKFLAISDNTLKYEINMGNLFLHQIFH